MQVIIYETYKANSTYSFIAKVIGALFFYFLFCPFAMSQSKNICIKFNPTYNDKALQLDSVNYTLENGDTINFTKFKFYVSNIIFYQNNKKIFAPKNSYYLIDAGNEKTETININIPNKMEFNSIEFSLGIDSITNRKGALGGALDPTKGMYWTWHSGYINFKVEGTCSSCTTFNKAFQFHLGGYKFPYNSLQKIKLSVVNQSNININVSVSNFIQSVANKLNQSIMTPGKEAVELSANAAKIFSMQ